MQTSLDTYRSRRDQLLTLIKESHPHIKRGTVLLIGAFEHERHEFRQESSFYYLTGITEPAAFLTIGFDGKTTLYMPHYSSSRSQWVSSTFSPETTKPSVYGVDALETLGKPLVGCTAPSLINQENYEHLSSRLGTLIKSDEVIFSLNPPHPLSYTNQKIILHQLNCFIPGLADSLHDIASLVARMRRVKSRSEIELMFKAIELTMVAQEGAAATIQQGKKEYEIQAGIEYIFRESGARPAFPSIVATGSHSTILHHTPSNRGMKQGELVVVDIGAELQYYCADLTRTYPVSGTFTKRQREIYTMVLDTQEYIAGIAAPGYWLNNKKEPERSLNHLAQKFLEEKGYAKYFFHSIGHFLGLDVHDVGNYEDPLAPGDVITIEPGIYLPEEGFGIRIEDNYWIIQDGIICLSEDLPKNYDLIEEMAQSELVAEDEYDDEETH